MSSKIQTESNTNANTKLINDSSIVKQGKIGSLLINNNNAINDKDNNIKIIYKLSNIEKEFIMQIMVGLNG